jgi:hypothetical protein
MPAAEDGRPQPPELERNITRRIAQRTKVRVQMLNVEVLGNRVVISGCVPCYYLKQLVLQAVLDVVGSVGASGVEFNVQVAAGSTNAAENADW